MIRTVILDDYIPSIELLEKLITENSHQFMIETFTDIDSCIHYLSNHKVDVLFLDIEINNRKGFEVTDFIEKIDSKTIIIYVSDYPSYALECINYRTMKFIEKKSLNKEIVPVIHKIEKLLLKNNDTIELQYRGSLKKLLLRQIVWISKNENNVIICYRDHHQFIKFSFYTTLSKIEPLLDNTFIKTNKGQCINLAWIQSFNKSQVKMLDGTIISVSRSKGKEVIDAYSRYEMNNCL